MSAPPYMKFFPADYFGDTHHLGVVEHGAYLLLLLAMWQAGGSLPAADANLARLARCTPEQWGEIRDVILPYFKRSRGRLTHTRIAKEIAKYESTSGKRSEAGKQGAAEKARKNSGQGRAIAYSTESNCTHNQNQNQNHIALSSERASAPAFETIWEAYPHFKGRSRKTDAETAWEALDEPTKAGMLDAIARMKPRLAEVYGGKGAPNLAKWLREGGYADWMAQPSARAIEVTPWTGPEEFRADAVRAAGEDFVRSYLDPAGWRNGADRQILALTGTAADRLSRELRPVLAKHAITVKHERALH